MSCPNGHDETEVQVREGKRVCRACKAKYKALTNRRIQSAVARNRNKRADSNRSNRNERDDRS